MSRWVSGYTFMSGSFEVDGYYTQRLKVIYHIFCNELRASNKRRLLIRISI